jgi:hypothetical protein
MKKLTMLVALFFMAFSAMWAQPIITVSGEITTNTTWTNDNIYVLSGFVYVEDGATLTIQAGTVIKGDKASKGTLIVTRTGKIQAVGNANQPIVFTSNEATPNYGDWGGIIILGKAPTNSTVGGTPGVGVVEGGVDNAEGDGRYGGGDLPGGSIANDNSGVLSYVRIEYPGIAFTNNNEINGLTMGGVGSGTQIDHIQVSYCADDSYEWFGGTVNCKYLIAYRGLDDDFDADNGYSGKIQFAFSQRDPSVADVSGSNGFEIDNDGAGSATAPKTRPIFSNVTICGPNGTVAADYRRGAHLRRNNETKMFNSVVIGSYPVGLFIDGATTAAQATLDSLTVRNTFFHGMATQLSDNDNTFDIVAWAAARQINVGPNAADAQLVDPFNLNIPNPRPGPTSPVLNFASFEDPRIKNDFFFTKVSYAGAFGPTGDWTTGWARFGNNLQQNGLASVTSQTVNVSGFITQNTTWTKNNTYVLNGFVYVKNCATLTIEPGTRILGDKATKGALIVTRCAKIIAEGTQAEPIVFTSSEATPNYGDWGGIIILGYAPTNSAFNGTPGLGQVEGGVNNAFGDGLYGGGDQTNGAIATDNSGVLSYVRIEYPGIAFTNNNEINGLTMGGVGSGTKIDHIQVSYCADDSYEWFGGTVNCKYLVAYRGLDDDFDADNGYSGKIQFAYSQRDPNVADASGSNGFEIDNDGAGSTTTPKTRPIFSNVTICGPNGTVAADYRRGAHLRRNNESKMFNSVVIGSYPVGLFIDGAPTAAQATLDSLTVRNTFFHGMATPLSDNDATFDIVAWAAARQVNVGTNSADAQLVDPFNLNLPNPRPGPTSPVLNFASFEDPRIKNDFFFTKVSYSGAFSPNNDWTAEWTRFGDNLQQIGLAPATSQTVNVSGFINQNTTWTKNNTYVLNGFVYVKNCATLTIEPGTRILGDKATKGALIVTRCAKIIAQGTETEPIVFTSSEATPNYGDWGGLIILGRAPTNSAFNGTAGLGQVEGGVNNAFGDGLYGGGDLSGGAIANDNSGILSYVRIEYPGIAFTNNNEINGLTMGGVGSDTKIDHIQVSYCADDSYEWFGGTVNCKYLIAYRGLDDDFDADNGYSGKIQFAYSQRDPSVADASGSNGFEIDNDGAGSTTAPKTRPIFSNVTVCGPNGTVAADYRRGAHLRRNNEAKMFNSVVIGSYPVGLFIDGGPTAAQATLDSLTVRNTFFHGMATPLSDNDNTFDIVAWAAARQINVGPNAADAQLVDPFNLNLPNPRPSGTSPVLNFASFEDPRIKNDFFFTKVDYSGAFGPSNDWTAVWSRFGDNLQQIGLAPATTQTVNVSGFITQNTTWTKNNTYVLNGFVYVKNCATLTIEPGTRILGDKATKGALIVTRCAKIIAQGTQEEPIVFTSSEATPNYGDWGGLIILGYAPTNSAFNGTPGLGQVEGGVNNAFGDGLYGGGDQTNGAIANDNSGILSYVRIEYPGIAFTNNNEINGLTMGGVGSGTKIDHIQVSYCADDSYEWFGGTVNCKYLIAYRGLDDDFDADNGYSGKIQFAYSQRDPSVADASGSNGFEIDNDGAGSATAPKTRPIFSNVTICGPDGTIAADYRRGAHLRRNNEAKMFNSVVIGSYPVGLFIDGATTAAQATLDSLTVRNTFFHGMATPLSDNDNTFDIAAWAAARQINVGPNSADAQLLDPFNLNLPNPRPGATSPVLGYASFEDPRIKNDFFFTKVSYAGAFSPSNDWTAVWSRFGDNLQQIGLAPAATATVNVSGAITQNTTWSANNTYILNGFVYVKNCATLTIEPGTRILGDKATKGALIVTRCAKINAQGTEVEPIVFTSSEATPNYGDWGGIIILGYAPTNSSFNGIPGLGQVEGGVNNAEGDGLYGGGDQPGGAIATDNSGVLSYVRIEYPGIAFTNNNEINGLTMGSVGSGTKIDHIQVSYCADDSYEWFGGTVDCDHLIAYRGLDDDFDADNGYSGNVQFALSVRDPQVADASGSNGFEIDNDAAGSTTTPKTRPTFSNVTVVGPSGTVAAEYRRAAHLRRNSEPGIFNTLLIGNYPVGLFIDGTSTLENAQSGALEVKNTWIAGATELLSPTNNPTLNVPTWFGTAGWGNAASPDVNAALLQDGFNLNNPNAQPTGLSPALVPGNAAFTAPRLAGFEVVDYVGAFDGVTDWTCQWAKFATLHTDCFVDVQDVEKTLGGVRLYPTVANQQTTLEVDLTKNADLYVEIYDLSGRYMGQQVATNGVAGKQYFTLNTSDMTPGFYFVRVQAGNAQQVVKMIVAH